jgi:phosphoenolpyruvate phosphomutase
MKTEHQTLPAPTATERKTTRLARMLRSAELEFLMEAHNGMSAKIAEEAGFRGLWGSGLTISASLGVRDNNEASWTQVLDVLEFMSDATRVPILLDGDTGYGNFNNMRRLVRKLEQREIAGVCIEDKLFPKTNSFINGERQELADIDEFAGKIKAAKDTQRDDDFCVVARVEALIAGWGMAEALRRAHAYREAGADAILIHSKLARADEILAFLREWGNAAPVVIVPTMYYSTPTDVFRAAGVSTIIWANHLMRTAVRSMQEVARQIHDDQNLFLVEERVAPVKELFRIQSAHELEAAEQRYLPGRVSGGRAIVLAASRGAELGELTRDRPKAMIPVHGEPLLQRQVAQFNAIGVRDVAVVVGYRADAVDVPAVRKVENTRYAETKEVHSLWCAREQLDGEVFISFGDILFKRYILHALNAEDADIAIVVDAARRPSNPARYTDHVSVSEPYSPLYSAESPAFLLQMDPRMDGADADGEWIGLMKASAGGAAIIASALEELHARPDFDRLRMCDLFSHLVHGRIPVRVCYISGHWLDVDDLDIYSRATEF